MEKPAIEGQFQKGIPATSAPAIETPAGQTTITRTYAWWLVLGLVGLDCFSTLGYLPTIAVEGAKDMAPLAAVAVSLLILFAALPVYLFVVGRSPNGRGATGLLEKHLSGWSAKLFVLFLLGFVATDFVITRTLSTADASKHLLENPYAKSGVRWMLDRKEAIQDALPLSLQGEWSYRFFKWVDEQLIVTVALIIIGFALYFFLVRGFTRGFVYAAAAIVALFLVVNGLVIGSSILYLTRHPQYLSNWTELIGSASRNKPAVDVFFDLSQLAIKFLPALALGLSGFELSMTVAPLVRGRPGDDPERPLGRIRAMRKLLVATAVLMAVFVPTSVTCVKFLVPPGTMEERDIAMEEQDIAMEEEDIAKEEEGNTRGLARHRALAYLAHGRYPLKPAGRRFGTDNPSGEGEKFENPDKEDEAMLPPPKDDKEEIERPQPEIRQTQTIVRATGADLNPLFGPAFGTLYDVSAVLILFLAGASVTISLRDFLPQYLTRYGMEMHWARRIGLLLHLFNSVVLIVVLAFHASVSHQQGAYATSVLVLLAAAALAALVDLNRRWRRSVFRDLASIPFLLVCLIFLALACWICYETPEGLVIALIFIVLLLISAAFSRWMRCTELRYYGFAFADEESGIRWEQIRRLEFQVLVPHRPDDRTLAEKEAEIRARHRLASDVPIIFIEAELGDPSDFQHQPLMQVVNENGREIIRVSQCPSIAHVLAAIALEFREVGRPPEMHFAWSGESPLASNLDFLLWGHGNVPWLVHALICRTEPEPSRQPRVVIG